MLERELGLEVELVEGHYGEFTVLVDDEPIVRGGVLTFLGITPSLRRVREALERALDSEVSTASKGEAGAAEAPDR